MPKAKPKAKEKALALNGAKRDEGVMVMYSPDIAKLLHRKTPKEFIDKHPYNGLDYVQIGYVRRCVESYCSKIGATWSFEVEDVSPSAQLLQIKHIVVKGRLTIVHKDNTIMMREQYGGSAVKFFKSSHRTMPNLPMDLGNDYKSAASDAFKKCASSFGIAQDVYEPKVEKKVDAYEKDQGNRNETEAEVQPESSTPASDPDDIIDANQMAIVAKLIHKSDLKDEATKYMKEVVGARMMTRLTQSQYKQLIDFAHRKGWKEAPF